MTAPNLLDELFAEKSATENHEAERAVLAALMRNPDAGVLIKLGISADLFTQAAAQEALQAIVAFLADGIQPDAATLRSALSDAALIEVETSLQESASAANLPIYVRLLKDCRRERQLQAARARLKKATDAGAPYHELAAIIESIRKDEQGDAAKSRFVDVSELCLLAPTENWLVKGYFALDSLTVLFGDPGCGKSFLAIDLACHVATGTSWRGCPVKAGKVLYVAGEGRNGLAKRFKAWFERYGEPPRNIQICTSPIALTDPAGIAALVADIQAMPEPPVLIVLDTVNRNFGPGDENATADMTKAVAGMDTLRNATRAAILGLHHSGHADKGRGRGSSVLRASTDVEYATEKNDHTVQVRCTKSKDFDYPAPLSWSLDKQPLPWADEDGLPLDSAVLNPTDTPAHDPASRLAGQPRKALELLDTLYQQQRGNLESSGHDPEQARVAAADWYEAMRGICEDKGSRNRLRRALIDGGHVRMENGFVYQVGKVGIR